MAGQNNGFAIGIIGDELRQELNGRHTADALPEIISFAKSQGYSIVPISELLHREDWYIDPADGAQRKRR